jgi:succinylglutamate desuccinylase
MATESPPVPVHQTVALTNDKLDAVSSLSTAIFGDGAGGFFSKPQPRKDAAAVDSLDAGYVKVKVFTHNRSSTFSTIRATLLMYPRQGCI